MFRRGLLEGVIYLGGDSVAAEMNPS